MTITSYDDVQVGAVWACCLRCRLEAFFTHFSDHVRRCVGEERGCT